MKGLLSLALIASLVGLIGTAAGQPSDALVQEAKAYLQSIGKCGSLCNAYSRPDNPAYLGQVLIAAKEMGKYAESQKRDQVSPNVPSGLVARIEALERTSRQEPGIIKITSYDQVQAAVEQKFLDTEYKIEKKYDGKIGQLWQAIGAIPPPTTTTGSGELLPVTIPQQKVSLPKLAAGVGMVAVSVALLLAHR